MTAPNLTSRRRALKSIEVAGILSSSIAIAAAWIALWSFGDISTDCDAYCGPLPGLGAISVVLLTAAAAWLAALIIDVAVLFIGLSRLLPCALLVALVAVPLLSAIIFG